MLPDEIVSVRRVVLAELSVLSDPNANDLARMFYLPLVHPANADHAFIEWHQGMPLDVEKALEIAPRSKPAVRDFQGGKHLLRKLPLEKLDSVFFNCAALGRIAASAKTIEPGHLEGFTLFWLTIQFDGGFEWFLHNVSGWGKSEKDIQQLHQSVEAGYLPLSCSSMCDRGLCSCVGAEQQCLALRESGRSRSPIAFAYGAINQRHARAKLRNLLGDQS
jgi:hypothetical protein